MSERGAAPNEAALIWCPFPDEDSAAAVAGTLIDESLVACVNIVPAVRSLYLWQGVRDEAREVGVLFKTLAGLLDQALARLCALHPYDTPAAVGWRCDGAGAAALEWLGELAPRG